jgi:hypothetical protein
MKKFYTLTLVTVFFANFCFAQTLFSGKLHDIYNLETELMAGNKESLFKIAKYLDSKEKVTEFLGYHRIETTEAEAAKRIIDENCVFTESEFVISPETTTKEFLGFLNQNRNKIAFSENANAFLLTQLEDRKLEYELVELSQNKKNELKKRYNELIQSKWVKENDLEDLIQNNDPLVLLKVASILFKARSRWNRYDFNKHEYIELLQHLTGMRVVVKNEKGKNSFHIEKDYRPDSQLNLLIFFAKKYKDFHWRYEKSVFVNSNLVVNSIQNERILFEMLSNDDDSIAFEAFLKLSTSDPEIVATIADEYEKAGIEANYALPTFPYRFVKQLSKLTRYYDKYHFDYLGSEKIKSRIEKLKEELPFAERYKLENEIIDKLQLEEITAFEYWALVYSSEWDLSYSAGRILNKYYSKNWSKIIANKKQLALYLKKSNCYLKLGIVGINNYFHDKFANSSKETLQNLVKLNASDIDLAEQISKVIELNKSSELKSEIIKKGKDLINMSSDFEDKLHNFTNTSPITDNQKNELFEILSKISYAQIGIAIKHLEKIEISELRVFESKYDFLKDDWGFNLTGDFDDEKVRNEFVVNYSTLSQPELYAYYLKTSEIDYTTTNNRLDFDKIYEMLKYDIVVAFAGGGGGKQERNVHSIIKILENEFKTTLGFPHKLCESKGTTVCFSDDRAMAWMNFFKKKKLLKLEYSEPISFSFK